MKRVAPILLLFVLACNSASSDHVSPSMPSAAMQPSAAAVPFVVELYSDEFCKGGNAWWSARINIFGAGSLDGSVIRVYTIDAHGARKFFGVAKSGVPELEGTNFSFYAEGIAPPDSIPDLHDVGYPPNYGFAPFGFDVYVGPHHELVGTGSAYSDITLTSNLFPHACPGIKPRTGCELQGGGVDGNGQVVATLRKHRSAIRVEGISTICSQEDQGIWFKVYSFVDDGTEPGHRILLAADHDPVVLQQGTYAPGVTSTSWQINIDFVPSAPLVEPNGVQPRVLLEAYGHGGKIGEVFCYLADSPDVGPRGPHPRGD